MNRGIFCTLTLIGVGVIGANAFIGMFILAVVWGVAYHLAK